MNVLMCVSLTMRPRATGLFLPSALNIHEPWFSCLIGWGLIWFPAFGKWKQSDDVGNVFRTWSVCWRPPPFPQIIVLGKTMMLLSSFCGVAQCIDLLGGAASCYRETLYLVWNNVCAGFTVWRAATWIPGSKVSQQNVELLWDTQCCSLHHVSAFNVVSDWCTFVHHTERFWEIFGSGAPNPVP